MTIQIEFSIGTGTVTLYQHKSPQSHPPKNKHSSMHETQHEQFCQVGGRMTGCTRLSLSGLFFFRLNLFTLFQHVPARDHLHIISTSSFQNLDSTFPYLAAYQRSSTSDLDPQIMSALCGDTSSFFLLLET